MLAIAVAGCSSVDSSVRRAGEAQPTGGPSAGDAIPRATTTTATELPAGAPPTDTTPTGAVEAGAPSSVAATVTADSVPSQPADATASTIAATEPGNPVLVGSTPNDAPAPPAAETTPTPPVTAGREPLVPFPEPPEAPDPEPLPPLPTAPISPPTGNLGSPTVYEAGAAAEAWVCDGEFGSPRTGFVFVRNPVNEQQVFIEVPARAWSAEEIVGSLLAAEVAVAEGRGTPTGAFDPATGNGVRFDSGDPVAFALLDEDLHVTEHPAESVPTEWTCWSIPAE